MRDVWLILRLRREASQTNTVTPLHPSHAADFLVAAQHFSEFFAMRTLCAGYVRARDQPAGLGPVRVTTPRRGHAPQRPQRGAGMEKAQQETCSSPEAVPARGRRPIRAVGAQESAARRRVTPTGELDETSRGRNLRGGRRETPGRAERSKQRAESVGPRAEAVQAYPRPSARAGSRSRTRRQS